MQRTRGGPVNIHPATRDGLYDCSAIVMSKGYGRKGSCENQSIWQIYSCGELGEFSPAVAPAHEARVTDRQPPACP